MHLTSSKSDREFKCDVRNDPNPGVRRISAKMWWIHCLFGVGHFAEFRKNWLMPLWEMLINLLKCANPQRWCNRKSDPESITGIGSPQKVNWFLPLVGSIISPSSADYFCSISADKQTEKHSIDSTYLLFFRLSLAEEIKKCHIPADQLKASAAQTVQYHLQISSRLHSTMQWKIGVRAGMLPSTSA